MEPVTRLAPVDFQAWAGAITFIVMGAAWGVWELLKKAGLVSVAKTETKPVPCEDSDCKHEFERMGEDLKRVENKLAALEAKCGKTDEALNRLDVNAWSSITKIQEGLSSVREGISLLTGILQGKSTK